MSALAPLALVLALGASRSAVAAEPTSECGAPLKDSGTPDPVKVATKRQLEEEMKKLIVRNAWAGVEKKFQDLLALGIPLPADDYFNGAQAARTVGKPWDTYCRLSAALQLKGGTVDQRSQATEEMDGLTQQYGRVDLQGSPRKQPTLTIAVMPFSPDQAQAITWAQEVLTNTGSFKGMLPPGDYDVSGQKFSILGTGEVNQEAHTGAAGNKQWLAVEIAKAGVGVGAIIYSGPVGSAGYHFMSSAAPGAPADASEAQPDTFGGSGFSAEGGFEIGFTQQLGVASTVGYSGIYGIDTVHSVQGWLAATFRPSILRIAVGPTYGAVFGSGTGVAPWWDKGQDPDRFPAEELTYRGTALAGGVRLSAGAGFVKNVDKKEKTDAGVQKSKRLYGGLELDGSWQTDGTRSYMGFGLRVGIMPMPPRFKG